jgi:hypothetical protein
MIPRPVSATGRIFLNARKKTPCQREQTGVYFGRKGWLTMFDTVDHHVEQNDPHSWKDYVGRAAVALVIVALLAGGIYLSVAGNS